MHFIAFIAYVAPRTKQISISFAAELRSTIIEEGIIVALIVMLLTLKGMKRRESEIGASEKATKLFLGLYKSYLNRTIMTYRILRAM